MPPRDKLEIILEDMDIFIAKQIVGLVFEIHAELVQATPVDLGWARAHYIPRIATPYRETFDGDPTAAGAGQSNAKALQELYGIAHSYKIEMGPIYISNNVPYIQKLNDGHSKQAPAGFIQLAVDSAVSNRGF